MTQQLSVENLSVDLDDKRIVTDVSFSLEPGEIGCLLGRSGCGKTTILNAIAGFEPPSKGCISLGGEEVATRLQQWPPEARRAGMVFQDLALFPHLTVKQNIGFGLKGQSRKEAKQRTDELLRLVGMQDHADSYPHQISGGQQQRIALIRAIAPRPPILLLDEPFSSQDAELRTQLANEVRMLLKRDGITGILVTHDQHEAFAIADHIGVVVDGTLRQCGNTVGDNQVLTELGMINGELLNEYKVGELVDLLVRPDDVIHDDNSPNKATVVGKHFRGADHLYTLLMPSKTRLQCLAPSHHDHDIGEKIGVKLKVDHLVVFPA